MLLTSYYGFWEAWQRYHIVTFDGPNKLIIVNHGETEIDIKNDVYSAWKEWMISQENDNAKYEPAMRSVGGDPTVGGEYLGSTFFLMNGWRMRTWEGDHRLVVKGNLFTEEGEPPFVPTVFPHTITIESQVSSINTAITPEGLTPATPEEISTQVWTDAPPQVTPDEISTQVWTDAPFDLDSIVQSVWDEVMLEHNVAGSFGKRLKEILPTLWGIK